MLISRNGLVKMKDFKMDGGVRYLMHSVGVATLAAADEPCG
jgi:hypothetical protein